MNCVFCEHSNGLGFFSDNRRDYAKCSHCEGVFVLKKCFIFSWCQEYRYSLHNNNLEDDGYRDFLQRFINPVLDFLTAPPFSILDYGSGPNPALVTLLNRYRTEDKLAIDTTIVGWDPFFAKDSIDFTNSQNMPQFDLVTCLEVAEHFENPIESFIQLARLVKNGGHVAIRTVPVPHNKPFLQWWYIKDQTHVSFYTEKAMQSIANRVGLQLIAVIDECIFILKKD